MHHKSKHDMHRTKQKKWVKGRHGENITTANGLFEGFEKSVTNLERKISVKIFKQNYGVLICKYSAFEGKGEVSLLTLTREGSQGRMQGVVKNYYTFELETNEAKKNA
jgi:hypothetical protein